MNTVHRAQFLTKGAYTITGPAVSNCGPSEIFETGDIVSLLNTQRIDHDGDVWVEAWDATLNRWDGDWIAADSLTPLDTTED